MAVGFSSVFSGLRHEKNISQRKAAADLKISQALLSHYENGVREPRLEFVVRACEYYGVSADYLLGRTNAKDNPMTVGSAKSRDEENLNQIVDSANLHSLINAIAVIFNLLSDSVGPKAIEELSSYISILVYKLLRHFDIAGEDEAAAMLRMPQSKFDALCDAAVKRAEAELAGEIFAVKQEGNFQRIPDYRLKKDFPQIYESIAELLEEVELKISEMAAQR